VSPATRVVAYDASGGMYAARLWWMLLWVGHDRAYVLDGGLPAWRDAGGTLHQGPPAARIAAPGLEAEALPPSAKMLVDYAGLRAGIGRAPRLIVDARAPDRFRGENETLDPVAGHIPGAVNRCFRDNLGSDGRFKPVEQLRAEWAALIGQRAPADLVHQCGSGVTACHNLLALAAAGLGGGRLYPGSWSEWCAQPDALVALGD
jgi:thiosulfate/3-mercaptopyruvate sulfurtransferase